MTFDAWKAKPGRPTLAALLGAVQGRVLTICRGVLQHPQEAEEAAQETLLKIVSGIEGVGDAEHFERWVGQVAERTALDRRRHSRRRKTWELVSASRASREADPGEGLNDAIARLPEDERELIVERYFERRTFDDMARRRGVSDVAVRKRLEKAHGRLKRILGSVMGLGVAVMKAKAAAIAVVIIPLLVLSGGVIVASVRRPSKAPIASTEQPKGSAKIATFLSEGKPAPAAPVSEPQKTAVDRAQIRAAIVANLERLRYVGRRSGECKELWPEASTEEEGRALQREKVALDQEWGEIYQRLCDLAAQDPPTIVDLVRTARDLPYRLRLMGLIAPDVNAEITSEDAASGPLLAGLLSLAVGDVEEKAHLASFAGQLTRANRELGQALLTLMNDADFHVRKHAGQSLWAIVDAGGLRSFLGAQISALKQAALRQGGELDYLCVGNPMKILASIGSEEADDFVLQRFEAMESKSDLETITAALIAAPRIAGRHQARLNFAVLRALDLKGHHTHHGLLQMAEHLPPEHRANIARVAEQNAPPASPVQLPRLMSVPSRARSVYRSMTGVSRWELYGNSSSSPAPRIGR